MWGSQQLEHRNKRLKIRGRDLQTPRLPTPTLESEDPAVNLQSTAVGPARASASSSVNGESNRASLLVPVRVRCLSTCSMPSSVPGAQTSLRRY